MSTFAESTSDQSRVARQHDLSRATQIDRSTEIILGFLFFLRGWRENVVFNAANENREFNNV